MNQPANHATSIPVGLASIAGSRDLITTAEFATALNKSTQTIRKNYSLTGEAYGIRPTKIGNRLLWSVAQTAKLLMGSL
jgi:hypothetical protein